jgi:hypothetical protein
VLSGIIEWGQRGEAVDGGDGDALTTVTARLKKASITIQVVKAAQAAI